ncbi:DUF2255 family protein [Streptomyces sp. NPDC046988]|uniref:DUF2255 family protein n=1 Tax=Streptomyces sp. NPDC046988 TaxID=3154922 RepID=UPI0033F12E18
MNATNAWTPEDLTAFAETYSLVLIAGDGERDGVEIGMVPVDGGLYVRAYRGTRSRWYQSAREHGHGRIRVGGVSREVVLTTRDLALPAGLDDAFRAKYGPVSDALIAVPQARAATIRVDPASAPAR